MKAKLQTMITLVLLNTHAYAGNEGDVLVMNAGAQQQLLEAGGDSRFVVDGYPATPPPSPVLIAVEETNPPLSPGQKRKNRKAQLPRQSSLEKVEEIPVLKEFEKKQKELAIIVQKKTIKPDFFSYLTLKIVVEVERKVKNREEMIEKVEKFIANFKKLPPLEQQARIKKGIALCSEKSGRLLPVFRALPHDELTKIFKRIDCVTFTTQ